MSESLMVNILKARITTLTTTIDIKDMRIHELEDKISVKDDLITALKEHIHNIKNDL